MRLFVNILELFLAEPEGLTKTSGYRYRRSLTHALTAGRIQSSSSKKVTKMKRRPTSQTPPHPSFENNDIQTLTTFALPTKQSQRVWNWNGQNTRHHRPATTLFPWTHSDQSPNSFHWLYDNNWVSHRPTGGKRTNTPERNATGFSRLEPSSISYWNRHKWSFPTTPIPPLLSTSFRNNAWHTLQTHFGGHRWTPDFTTRSMTSPARSTLSWEDAFLAQRYYDILTTRGWAVTTRRSKNQNLRYSTQTTIKSSTIKSYSTDAEESRIRVAMTALKERETPAAFKDYFAGNRESIHQQFLDTLVQEYSTPESESGTFSESKIDKAIGFARQAFEDAPTTTTGYSTQRRPTRVAIMVVLRSTDASETVKKVKDVQNQMLSDQVSDFNLFIIMVGFDKTPDILSIRNTISIDTFSEKNYQAISMAICLQCKQGWLKFIHPKGRRHLFSCYRVNEADAFETWHDASSRCKKINADLVSIESRKELNFLNEKLRPYVMAGMKVDGRHNSKLKVYIYLGLFRDQDSLEKEFQWVSKNPMILTNWERNHEGRRFSCVAWTQSFRFHELIWRHIDCGYPLTKLSVCEVVHSQLIEETATVFTVDPADEDVFNKALTKREFASYHKQNVFSQRKIVHTDILSAMDGLQDSRLLFSCDENSSPKTSISYVFVCDHINHCSNGRDESICQYRTCVKHTEFKCNSGQCIPSEARCDLFNDCLDGSDELDCLECKGHRCSNGDCLPKHLFFRQYCDHYYYLNGPYMFFNADKKCVFICNRNECVFPDQLNNGVTDCQGPEGHLDETIGKLEVSFDCPLGDNEIWAPRCVYIKDRYKAVIGCSDRSHLRNCIAFECPEGYVKCPDSYCIPLHYVQDGNNDCPMGEDEQYIENRTCVGNFACWESRVCLHPDLVCDRQPHCPHGDDELNCHVTCTDGFQCLAGTVTVTDYDKYFPLKSVSFVDSRVRYLDLSGVDISSVQDGDHLINLIEVHLSNCKLTNVKTILAVSAYRLNTVYLMDLSRNLIEEIGYNNIFNFMDNLHILDLSHNKRLTVLTDGAFIPFSQPSVLHTLDLSYTGLNFLNKSVLLGLNGLKLLNLTGTLIVNYRQKNFPENFVLDTLDLRRIPIKYIGSESFKGLTIESNLYTDDFRLCCPQIRGPGIPNFKCQAPNDVISSCFDLVKDDIQRSLLWLVASVSVVGNTIVLSVRVVLERDMLTKSYGLFISNLGISDLLMGCYLLIIAGADLKYRDVYVTYEREWRSSMACQTAGFLSTLSSEVSTFFIFLVTLDRFLIIKFPFGQVRFSKKTMILATVLAWSLGFLLALIPLLPYFDHWTVYSSNGMCLGLPLTTERGGGWEYSVFVFIGLNFSMFVLVVCGQLGISRAMSTTQAATNSVTNDPHNGQVKDISVARRLSLLVVSDCLCWFAVGIMSLLAVSGRDIGQQAYAWSAILIIPINSALNPLLYSLPILYSKWNNFKKGYHHKKNNSTLPRNEETEINVINSKAIPHLGRVSKTD